MKGMNERFLNHLASNIDSEDIQDGISKFVDKKVFPELEEIRERAIEDDDAETARGMYESMPPEKREQIFHGVLGDIIATMFEIRVRPTTGLREAKKMLRDPYTMEAVLLIFDHPDVDDGKREEMKGFAANHVRALGVAIAPEMYQREEVLEVADEFGVDRELVEYYDDQYEIEGEADVPDAAASAED